MTGRGLSNHEEDTTILNSNTVRGMHASAADGHDDGGRGRGPVGARPAGVPGDAGRFLEKLSTEGRCGDGGQEMDTGVAATRSEPRRDF